MAHSQQSLSNLNLATDIESLASIIVSILDNDRTLIIYARAISQFILFSSNIPFGRAKKLFVDNPRAKFFLMKLLKGRSDFLKPTPRCIGVDISSFICSGRIQQSLDAKHSLNLTNILAKPTGIVIAAAANNSSSNSLNDDDNNKSKSTLENENSEHIETHSFSSKWNKSIKQSSRSTLINLERKTPRIKTDILHTDPIVWIRFYSQKLNIKKHSAIFLNLRISIITVCADVYEAYINDKHASIETVSLLMRELEQKYDSLIIFCSELNLFLYNPILFLSNYLKFTWCYVLNRNVFDPVSIYDLDIMISYLTYGFLYLNTNNLTNMPEDTHNPLIAYTGERPRNNLSKFKNKKIYINEGTRAMQTTNKSSDTGSISNYIEIITAINIDTEKALKNII